ncbi:hypothetical protein [Leadbetterella byssophila]|uniref:DUF3592 domain-containing protein n=1 Tax=Leadbetterella byssophila (strain DSM 17132 / JCM 16389 / KACC 11308 / NBRC 106382 / 4M15) TaxID=649349 RepID=E4RXE4_LEAB4|nr:hypothetical protein [Leadbetterella byssophila]ADQ16289.1 hypothetical protein Lbys_0517 [Leadbetterella byssophila DSM 17132]
MLHNKKLLLAALIFLSAWAFIRYRERLTIKHVNEDPRSTVGVLVKKSEYKSYTFHVKYLVNERSYILKAKVPQYVYVARNMGDTLPVKYSNAKPRFAILD